MISKERLKELIEQGATIYEVKYGKINPVSLKNKIRFISEKYPVIVFEPRPNEKYKHHKYFDKLFETKEEAEWHREFGCIERTERLELPTWEKIEKEYNKSKYKRKKFGTYEILKFVGKKTENDYVLEIFVDNYTKKFIGLSCFVKQPLTKENYTLACRKAKELFLGE